jgi:hypothetical protein
LLALKNCTSLPSFSNNKFFMCLIVSVSFFSEKSLISWKNGSADGHAESTTACADGGSGNRGFQADTSKLFSFFKAWLSGSCIS